MFWGLFEAYPVAVGLFLVFLFTALVAGYRWWLLGVYNRIFLGVVQVGELAISMVTIYLWPNAP